MELSDYLRIIRQRGWIIILLAVLTAVAAFGYSKMQTPVYESNLRLLVRPARTDFGQSQAARELLGNYEQWLRSSYRAQAVIDQLQLDMTAGELLGDVSVASDRLGLVLQLVVENTDGDLGNDIAMAWGNLLIQWQQGENEKNRQEDRITIEFQDNPQYSLASPQTKINTAAGFVFGALLGIILIFLLEWLESGVMRRSEDVERYLDIPVVGRIPNQ
ncbi:MAG TPA: Wzz/FepE/Etk N-terminal domain-containing protein [Chloroflexota bacterium]|nr:Wzz/FepE/Etk N-terminal domain-containing protein [Chloroflexota bacterium]HUM67710.1 Wzz/FepE/Etk N-terminal domain-containing protein [Chloroflexota bacterium]